MAVGDEEWGGQPKTSWKGGRVESTGAEKGEAERTRELVGVRGLTRGIAACQAQRGSSSTAAVWYYIRPICQCWVIEEVFRSKSQPVLPYSRTLPCRLGLGTNRRRKNISLAYLVNYPLLHALFRHVESLP